jgi:predicted site-specific integrase-resolvase
MKAKEVKSILNITQQTLHNYIKEGKISFIKINKYHYDYNDNDVYKLIGLSNTKKQRYNVTYSRVSLSKQKDDLARQTERLYNYCMSNGISIEKQYEDVKSGMNFNDRRSFNDLLTDVIKGNIDSVIIENKDRLARFGFELIESFFKFFDTKIIVVNNVDNKSYENELTEDLISIIHYFSMKSYSNRRKLNKFKKEIEENIV